MGLIGEVHCAVVTVATGVYGTVLDLVGLGVRGALIGEGPAQRSILTTIDTCIDLILILCIGPSVDAEILGEDISGLVTRAAETVSQDVSGITVLHSIIVQHAGVLLGAGSGISSLTQIILGDGYRRRSNNRLTIVVRVVVSTDRATTDNEGIATGNGARYSGAHTCGVAGCVQPISIRCRDERSKKDKLHIF